MRFASSFAIVLGVVLAATFAEAGERWTAFKVATRFHVGSRQHRTSTVRRGPLDRALEYVRLQAGDQRRVLAEHSVDHGAVKMAKRYEEGRVRPGAVVSEEHKLVVTKGRLTLETATMRIVPKAGTTQAGLLAEAAQVRDAVALGHPVVLMSNRYIDFDLQRSEAPINPLRPADLRALRRAIPDIDSSDSRASW